MVIPDGDLFDPTSHQRFVKFGEVGSLLCDIILQVIDPLYLLVSYSSVDGSLTSVKILFMNMQELMRMRGFRELTQRRGMNLTA